MRLPPFSPPGAREWTDVRLPGQEGSGGGAGGVGETGGAAGPGACEGGIEFSQGSASQEQASRGPGGPGTAAMGERASPTGSARGSSAAA
jgi:hypothetical protein